MNKMSDDFLFIVGLGARLNQIELKMAGSWPLFSDRLSEILRKINKAKLDAEIEKRIKEIIDLGLDTPAADEIRALIEAAEKTSLDNLSIALDDLADAETPETDSDPSLPVIAKEESDAGSEKPDWEIDLLNSIGVKPDFKLPDIPGIDLSGITGSDVIEVCGLIGRKLTLPAKERPKFQLEGLDILLNPTKKRPKATGIKFRDLDSELQTKSPAPEKSSRSKQPEAGSAPQAPPKEAPIEQADEVHEAMAGDSEDRYFNVLFTEPRSDNAIPPDQPLIHSKLYNLFVNISPERIGLGKEETAFPEQVLDEVWDKREPLPLTVWAASREFEIKPQIRRLNLPPTGPSEAVRFDVRSLFTEGRGYIRVEIFYRGHLLQSKRVEAVVAAAAGKEAPVSLRPVQDAYLTFTAAGVLDPEAISEFPERVLTLNVEQDPRDDSLDIRILDRTKEDKELAYFDNHLQPEGLGEAIEAVRRQLKLTVTGSDSEKGYLGKNSIPEENERKLNAWLPRLAEAGRKLYRSLFSHTPGMSLGEDRGEQLPAALHPGAVIQVNPVSGVTTIPWALLYERKIKFLPGKTRVCENFAASAGDCENCSQKNDPYVVCPYAFWGYRYIIEQIPCWLSGETAKLPTLIHKISNGKPLYLNMNVHPEFSLWRDHRAKIETAGKVRFLLAEKVSEMETLWENHSGDLDIVYFYSHGGVDEHGPYLELSGQRIGSNFLEASEINWPHAPLVYLNGCATGDYGPESYVSLIDDFRTAGASGIIGTECPVPESFAEAYAAEILPRLFHGERLGQAMLAVRLNFLKQQKNPLGLVYTLYATNEITLAQPVA